MEAGPNTGLRMVAVPSPVRTAPAATMVQARGPGARRRPAPEISSNRSPPAWHQPANAAATRTYIGSPPVTYLLL
jgi:hypothetical protein